MATNEPGTVHRGAARVLVVGGGIGGLATALAVAEAGHDVVVLERSAEMAELGAGIQIAPNGFRALAALGVAAAVRDRAVHVEALRLMDGATGRPVQTLGLGTAYRDRFGEPYAVVHRADLYAPLLASARRSPRIELRAGCAVSGYEQHRDGVTAVLADGRREDGDLLVGADGIRSVIRAQMLGDGPPLVSGHTIYRSMIPMEQVPGDLYRPVVTLWAGPGWHVVHYPVAGGTHLNLAAVVDDGAQVAVVGVPAGHTHVLSRFPRADPAVRRLLELGRDWRQWVICDRDPVRSWSDGRVVVLGDAAHPMLQYAAQGACMALEDAVLLGVLLRCPPGDFPRRVAEFVDRRRERTARTTEVARALGAELYHPAGEAAAARNGMLAALSAEDMHDRVAWLHGHEPRPDRVGSGPLSRAGRSCDRTDGPAVAPGLRGRS